MLATILVAAGMCSPLLMATPGAAAPEVAADPRVVTRWNEIAARTITENRVPGPVSALYFGFVSLAVYDAVVAIEGRYEPYAQLRKPHPHASSEVAAATAAYRVLRHYFPGSAGALDADYAAALAGVPEAGREDGEQVGQQAAEALIAARDDDGRDNGSSFQGRDGVGQWEAAPGSTMVTPWLGSVRPLTLDSPTQFPLPGPDPVTSAAYATDFDEVEAYGGAEDSSRTPEQTATALFWNVNPSLQYQAALRRQVAARGLDIADRARAFALLGSATADALIACWRAKIDYNYWRPDVAIPQAAHDGNAATRPRPHWEPFRSPTPAYPEYPSGHACTTGAASETFGSLFGATGLGLVVTSPSSPSRTFATTQALDAETMNARIWLGIHFRRAMTDGNALGHAVGRWAGAEFFGPAS